MSAQTRCWPAASTAPRRSCSAPVSATRPTCVRSASGRPTISRGRAPPARPPAGQRGARARPASCSRGSTEAAAGRLRPRGADARQGALVAGRGRRLRPARLPGLHLDPDPAHRRARSRGGRVHDAAQPRPDARRRRRILWPRHGSTMATSPTRTGTTWRCCGTVCGSPRRCWSQPRWPGGARPARNRAISATPRCGATSSTTTTRSARRGWAPTRLTSVCDERGRVHGLERLVVADASLMPTVPRANTNIPAIVVAERIASMLADQRP